MNSFFKILGTFALGTVLIGAAKYPFFEAPSVAQEPVADEYLIDHLAKEMCAELSQGTKPTRAGVRVRLANPQYSDQIDRLHKAGTFIEDLSVAAFDTCPATLEAAG